MGDVSGATAGGDGMRQAAVATGRETVASGVEAEGIKRRTSRWSWGSRVTQG